MKYFKEYLKEKRLPAPTIRAHYQTANAFQEWVDKRRYLVANIRYPDLIRYMERCEKRVHSKEKLQLKFLALRHYFNYLMERGQVEYNPVRGVYPSKHIERKTLSEVDSAPRYIRNVKTIKYEKVGRVQRIREATLR